MFRIFQPKEIILFLFYIFYCLIVPINVEFQDFIIIKISARDISTVEVLQNSFTDGLKSSDADITIKQVKLCQTMSLAC